MIGKFTIEGRLPGMNEIIAVAQRNRYGYGDFKKKYTDICAWASMKIKNIKRPIRIDIWWYEPNSKRDIDNVCGGGQKFVLDGLVKSGKLPNDDQKWVKEITHHFHIDREKPRVEIIISEV